MTEEEKTMRILDAQEHPEHYTGKEADDIMEDAAVLADLKRALAYEDAQREDIDVDKAWKKFETRHSKRHPSAPHWLKIAASVIGVLFAGAIAYAAGIGLGIVGNPFAREEGKEIVSDRKGDAPDKASTVATVTVKETAQRSDSARIINFDNEELEVILSQMADYYKVKVAYGDDNVRHVRLHFKWDQAKSLDDVVALLNSFRQINIKRNGDTLTAND